MKQRVTHRAAPQHGISVITLGELRVLATRKARHFAGLGLRLLNPCEQS